MNRCELCGQVKKIIMESSHQLKFMNKHNIIISGAIINAKVGVRDHIEIDVPKGTTHGSICFNIYAKEPSADCQYCDEEIKKNNDNADEYVYEDEDDNENDNKKEDDK